MYKGKVFKVKAYDRPHKYKYEICNHDSMVRIISHSYTLRRDCKDDMNKRLAKLNKK